MAFHRHDGRLLRAVERSPGGGRQVFIVRGVVSRLFFFVLWYFSLFKFNNILRTFKVMFIFPNYSVNQINISKRCCVLIPSYPQ